MTASTKGTFEQRAAKALVERFVQNGDRNLINRFVINNSVMVMDEDEISFFAAWIDHELYLRVLCCTFLVKLGIFRYDIGDSDRLSGFLNFMVISVTE
jgi:hypothetical protein